MVALFSGRLAACCGLADPGLGAGLDGVPGGAERRGVGQVQVADGVDGQAGGLAVVHWSVPDPVPASDPAGFDAALDELADRIRRLAPRLAAAS